MSKLFSLLTATMSGGLKLFNYSGKTERSKRVMPFLLGTLIGVMMLQSASVMAFLFKEDNAESVVLVIYALITTLIILMEGSYKSIDLLFKPKDNDMLLAMPIKKSTIVFARIIKFYVFEMVYCLIFLLPAIIAYAMVAEVGLSYYVVAITMLVLIPVIPITIACIIGLVISLISGRFRHKTFLQIALSFLAMFATVGLVFLINMSPNNGEYAMIAISNKVTEFYYPASTFVNLVTNFNIWEYLIFIVVNLAIMGLTVIVISRFCFKIITRLATVKQIKNVNVNYNLKKHSQTFAMVKKEMTRYFCTPVLLMNTAMGLVFFVIAVGAILVKFDDIVNSLTTSVEEFPLTADKISSYLPSVTLAMVAFASLLTCITATLISLEGKAFNILKSLPISGKKVIMTKVLAATLLIVPVTAIGSLVMAFRFQFGFLDTLLVLIGVVLMPLVTELIGVLINIKYPRFDAENDTVVVRQSASVMVATFLGLGMVLVTESLIFVTVFLAGQTAGLMMVDAVFAIITLFLYFVIASRGEEKYLKLTA